MDYISQILERANKTLKAQNELTSEMTLDIDGTELKIKRLPIGKVLQLLQEAKEDNYNAELELIYLSAYETFNNDSIMQLNETAEPHNIVKVVFGDNAMLINQIALAIINWYDLDKTINVQVKELKK